MNIWRCTNFSRLSLQKNLRTYSSTTTTDNPRSPRPPLKLDPALQALLNDADLSLLRVRDSRVHRELEIIKTDTDPETPSPSEHVAPESQLFPSRVRKSPAASFGSRRVGVAVLSFELQRSIVRLISETDKPLVHADAQRLFQENNSAEDAWSTRYTPPDYTVPSAGSRMAHIKARIARHRDGTAFASVVMPAQYAVVSSVLANAVTRLGQEWAAGVDRIVEWGSGTGAGLWAAMHTFRDKTDTDPTVASSRIASYIGIEKREGLTTIARRLLRDVPLGGTMVSFQKSLHSSDRVPRTEGLGTIAMSSFTLSTLGSPGLRRQVVREMWDSGADVIVIIDEASTEGFSHVAEARELLLKYGRRETKAVEASGVNTAEDGRGKRGSYIIAPCPHDFACPLALATRSGVRCTFEQRLQRPSFVRRTKHAGAGEEDVGYAYVIVRRGSRPEIKASEVEHLEAMARARVGTIGRWEEESARAKELAQDEQAAQQMGRAPSWEEEEAYGEMADAGGAEAGVIEARAEEVVRMNENADARIAQEALPDAEDSGVAEAGVFEARAEEVARENADADASAAREASTDAEDGVAEMAHIDEALEDALRVEAYRWPRINFPPLKRSGHILIDACMPNGQEMRMTFPRSQGKQVFYDARKSAWGDLFPHTPKHRPVPRYVGVREGAVSSRENGGRQVLGGDGALAKVGLPAAGRARWEGVMKSLKEQDLLRRHERRRRRSAKEMSSELGGESVS